MTLPGAPLPEAVLVTVTLAPPPEQRVPNWSLLVVLGVVSRRSEVVPWSVAVSDGEVPTKMALYFQTMALPCTGLAAGGPQLKSMSASTSDCPLPPVMVPRQLPAVRVKSCCTVPCEKERPEVPAKGDVRWPVMAPVVSCGESK